MLHTELLRLINSKECWAFVGSGPSIDAGAPTWERLLDDAVGSLTIDEAAELDAAGGYQSARDRGNLPTAFAAIESVIGRSALDRCVKRSLQSHTQPGAMHQALAELPFAGYVTTNYDNLLEKALNAITPGWVPVGNVDDEVRKANGTATGVVWHVHGSVGLNEDRSRLVITDEDYARLYLDGSRVLQQMTGLLANRRAVIIGFGFRDQDVMHALKTIGRLTDATRPIFALVEKNGEFKHTIDRRVFLRQYNIDVQPYRNEDGRHQNLGYSLNTYKSLSLRRSLRYGRHLSSPPEYDPETTGLLIYNDMVLNAPIEVPKELRSSILRSRVLAVCQKPRGMESIRVDLEGILNALSGRVDAPASQEQLDEALEEALQELVATGLLVHREEHYALSDQGRDLVLDHSATSSRIEDQFSASLRTRLEKQLTPLGRDVKTPLKVLRSFFRKAIERRALGVALAFATGGMSSQQDYHALALLQSITEWLDKAADEIEALAVIQTIQEVFREPSPAEETFISTSVQGRFVLHLLSLDNDTLAVRMRELENSLFLIDSSTLIPWLALGSSGNSAAVRLLSALQNAGATVATTWPLAEEVAEHVRWAVKLVQDAKGIQSEVVLEAATGRAGVKTNAFLEGYFASSGSIPDIGSFEGYISRCLGGLVPSGLVNDSALSKVLTGRGVKTIKFGALVDGMHYLAPKARAYQDAIGVRRRAGASYKHERQVRAEAEAVVIVEAARGEFRRRVRQCG